MAPWSFLCIWIVCACILCSGDVSEDVNFSANYVMVETGSGKIVGRHQGPVNSYLGIPYAEKPTGRFRFRPPRPKRPWYPALYQALNYGPECLQSTLYYNNEDSDAPQVPMDEDCLYLNIWQPSKSLPDGKLHPVMIWIYGGAFIHGSASKAEYEGSRLAARRNGVIVVSLNYRLGALGFLVSTADGLYGNYGLADQKTAIQWVKDNIIHFGGDPNRITLFGESAGAMSIGLHMLDQEAHLSVQGEVLVEEDEVENEGVHTNGFGSSNSGGVGRGGLLRNEQRLFHSVILQSNPLGYKYRSIAVANFIGESYKEYLDCEDLRCLQSESAEELIHVQDTLMAVPRSIGDFFTWGPVATDQAYYREVRLRPGPLANVTVRQPIEALEGMHRLHVPVLIGTNSHEGTVFVFTAYPTRMAKFVFQALIFSFFRFSAPKVLRMYAPLTKMLSRSPYPDYRLVLSRIIGDYLFKCPNSRFASLLAAAGAPVFHYEFALPTRTPGFPCCDGLSCHTCELPYVFNQMGVIETDYSWQEGNKNIPHTTTSAKSNTPATPITSTSASTGTTTGTDTTTTPSASTHSIAAESVGGAPAGSKGGVVDGIMSTDWDNLADPTGVGGMNGGVGGSGTGSSANSGASANTHSKVSTNTYPYTTTAASATTTTRNTDSFPDIFGAGTSASGVYNNVYNTITGVYDTIHNMYKSRSTIDSEVSGMMSDYWTTFATYGDPNGQPFDHSSASDHSSGGMSGPMNGYVAGTRVDSLPWWPRLLGDLPMPTRNAQYDSDSGDESSSGIDCDSGDSGDNSDGNSDNAGDGRDSDDTTGYEYTSPTIYSAIGSGSEDTAWAAATLHDRTYAESNTRDKDSTGTGTTTRSSCKSKTADNNRYTTPPTSTPTHTTHSKHTRHKLDMLIELNANRNLIDKLRSNYVQAVPFMHQMVFDEASSVNIIENDCICNQWNELNYRF